MAEDVPEEIVIDDEDPDEYNVEDIRAKRKNPKTGLIEYFVKWEGYPESENTWEPSTNLKCPDLIAKFYEIEKEKKKRKRRSITDSKQPKRAKTDNDEDPLILEEDNDVNSIAGSVSHSNNGNEVAETVQPKGFERGLKIERIIGSCVDDDKDQIWFFIKWKGLKELELVDVNEIEENEPKALCSWYRERLYYAMKNPTETEDSLEKGPVPQEA